jgi:hypothetical protein
MLIQTIIYIWYADSNYNLHFSPVNPNVMFFSVCTAFYILSFSEVDICIWKISIDFLSVNRIQFSILTLLIGLSTVYL